jgi:hypothetical protein
MFRGSVENLAVTKNKYCDALIKLYSSRTASSAFAKRFKNETCSIDSNQ